MCVHMPNSVQEWSEKWVWAHRQEPTESKRTDEKNQVFTWRKKCKHLPREGKKKRPKKETLLGSKTQGEKNNMEI